GFCLLNQATSIRKFLRCLVPHTAVWPLPVIVYPPFFYDQPRLMMLYKPVLVQTLISHPPVEAFYIRVLHWSSRIYKVKLHFLSHCPRIDCVTGELQAIINDNHLWLPSALDEA